MESDTPATLLAREHELLREHSHLVEDACGVVEGLDRAACPGHVTQLVQLAAGAALAGYSAADWHAWVEEALGEHGQGLLQSSESCMRESGLWPWSR